MRIRRARTGWRLRRTVAATGAVALLLTACGGGDGGESTDDGGQESSEDGGEDEEAAGEPQEGGTFTLGAFSGLQGLDPVRNQGHAPTGGLPGEALYDTLMQIDPETGEVEPDMAASLEPTDEAGQTWEMELNEGITFHDGTELDAEAVKFNIERHQNPENRSNFINHVTPIESMEADGHTLTFQLRHPWAAFPYIFTHVVGHIASPTAIEEAGEEFNQAPVGAGPFEFEEWAPGDQLTLTAYEDYWRSDEGLPYLDEWTMRVMPDEQTRMAAIESGEVDVVFSPYMTDAVAGGADIEGVSLWENYGNMGGGFMLNTQAEHTSDKRVRQAIAHLVDYEGISQVTHDGHLPEGERGIFREDSQWYSGVEWPEHDPEQGQQLLDEYLSENGLDEITIQLRTLPERRGFAELVQQMLDVEGMSVEIDMLEVTEYVPAVFGGDYQMTIWSLPHPADPDLQIYNNFHSQSPQNAPQIENEELDEAIMTGRTSMDTETRQEAYAKVSEILAEEQPYVMTSPSVQALLQHDHVHGIEPLDSGMFGSEEIWIEQE